MKAIACLLALCVVGALAAPEKNEEPKRDKRGYLSGYGYSGLGSYYGGGLGYAGYGGGNLGYSGYGGYGGHGGYGGYRSYVAPAITTRVIAAPAVSYASYPYYGGYYGGNYGGYSGGYAYAAPGGAGWW